MKGQVIVALITAIASLGGAYITATFKAEQTTSGAKQEILQITEETTNAAKDEIFRKIGKLAIVTAGQVTSSGTVKKIEGVDFGVNEAPLGKYRVTFRQSFAQVPTVVATSDGIGGGFVQITEVDTTGFTIEGRDYDKHALTRMGFHFIAVLPTSTPTGN